jgi:hypothetical protein
MRPGRLLALAVLAAGLAARPSHADAIGFGPPQGWFVPVGVNVGLALLSQGAKGALLGVEGSVVHLDRSVVWWGGYADALFETNQVTGRFSIGPEVGWAFVGVDGGVVGFLHDARFDPGLAIRPMLTFGFVSLYFRGEKLFLPGQQVDDGQVGLLVKWPFELKSKDR